MEKKEGATKDDDGWTALHYAALNENKDVIGLLLEKMEGDDVGVKDVFGRTALDWAVEFGHMEVVSLLTA